MPNSPEFMKQIQAKSQLSVDKGRPKGSKGKKTIIVEDMRKEFEKQAQAKWQELITKQLSSAFNDSQDRRYTIDQMIGKAMEMQKIEQHIDFDLDL